MLEIKHETSHLIGRITLIHTGIYILAISPPPFEGGLHEKRKGKGGKRRKKEKSDKIHVKIPL